MHIAHYWLHCVLVLFSSELHNNLQCDRSGNLCTNEKTETQSDQVTYWTSLGSLVLISLHHSAAPTAWNFVALLQGEWWDQSLKKLLIEWGAGYSYIKSNRYSRKYFLSSYDRYSSACIIIIIPVNKLFKSGYACSWACEMQRNTFFPKPLAQGISVHFPPSHITPNIMAWNTSDHDERKA